MFLKRCPKCQREYPAAILECPDDGTSLEGVEAKDPMIGQVLEGKYKLESQIGSGGMAAVYLATRLQLGDNVAVKVLNADSLKNPLAVARFKREAQAAARIRHSSVVTIHDLGNLPQGNTFLVMEYIRGHSLRDELKNQTVLSPARAIEIISAVCAGVQAAHDAGIIHRDLKPENIMIEPHRDGGYSVKVVDFGVADLREHVISDALTKLTEAGMMVGTPYYISPEQCKGEELDHRSDIYSLGVILYELLTGTVPFRGKTLSAVIIQHATEPPPPIRPFRPEVSEQLEAVVMKALSKDRAKRPATAAQFAQELNQILNATTLTETEMRPGISTRGFTRVTEGLSSQTNPGVAGFLAAQRRTTTGLQRKSGLLNYDSLTGLHSYPYFLQRLEETVARALQNNEPLAVIFFGIDKFKKINDSYGYLLGDMALREVGALLAEESPQDALLCRSPGDGFVMMTTGKQAKVVDQMVERLTHAVSETKFLSQDVPGGYALTISAGIAMLPDDGKTASELIEYAQRALRQVKMRKQPIARPEDESAEPHISFEHFVGRKKELDKLNREFEMSVAGRGRLVFIVGDAGLGKTRLVDEFRRRIVGKDVLFLQGRFYESGGALPYKVFCDSLRGSIHYLAEHSLEELEAVFGSLSDRVINDFTSADPLSVLLNHSTHSGNAEQEKYKIFDYLTRIYSSLSRVRPVMLFLDDLQWADELTLDFLAYLIRAAERDRLFIVATMRDWEISNEGNPVRIWLRQMSRYGSYEQIKLTPLTESEVRQILEQNFGKIQISASMLSLICAETKGNAFYLIEILRLLLEEKAIQWANGKWRFEDVSEIKLPNSVVDLVEAHLVKLPTSALEVFTSAAVLGDGFSFDMLAAVTDMDEDELLPIIEAGLRERILREEVSGRDDHYVFYHSTMRKVLYDRTSRRRRKRLHQQIGRRLEEMYGARAGKIASDLAYHYYQGEDYEHALRYAVEAGNLAWRALAISEALKYYEWAEKSIQNLTASLREEGGSKGPSQVLQLAACGLHLEADMLALYHLNYGRLLMQIGQHKRAESELRQTLELARQVRSLKLMGRTFTALGELYRQYGHLARGLEYGEQGLALLSSIEDTEWEVQALLVIGASHEGLGSFSAALETYEGALALARKIEDKLNEANSHWGLGFTYYRLGQYDKAKTSAQKGLEIATSSNDRLGQQRCHNLLGSVYVEIGQFEEGLSHFDSALKIARDLGYRLSEAYILSNIGENYRLRGLYSEAISYYDQALVLARETNDRVTEGMVLLNLGLVEQGKGNHEKALEQFEKALRLASETGATPTELEIIVAQGSSLLALNRVQEASEHYHRALDISRHSGSPVFEWQALRGLSKIERINSHIDEAIRLLRLSIEIVEMMSADLKRQSDRDSFLKDKQMLYSELAELTGKPQGEGI